MTLCYLDRLICLAAVVTGLVHTAIELGFRLIAPPIQRLIAALPVRRQERLLYLLQLAPMGLALLFTGALCVPGYVRNETNLGPESVSWICVAAALAVALWYGVALLRGLVRALRTVRFVDACRRAGSNFGSTGKATPILVCPGMVRGVALVGLFRPCIVISEKLLGEGGLSRAALEVALDHERSHAAQLDNWKLFSLQFVARLGLRLPGGRTWMELWQNAAECAADDDAVRGDSTRVLVLAETLVAVARTAGARPAMVYAALAWGEADLRVRIERLLGDRGRTEAGRRRYLVCVLAVLPPVVLGAAVSLTLSLNNLSEHLLHLR